MSSEAAWLTTDSAFLSGDSCATIAVVSGVAFTVSGVPSDGAVAATLTSGATAPLGSVTTMMNGAVLPICSVQL